MCRLENFHPERKGGQDKGNPREAPGIRAFFLFGLSAVLYIGKCPDRVVKLLELAVLESYHDTGLLVAAYLEDVLGTFELCFEILDDLVAALALHGPAFSFDPDEFVNVLNFFLCLLCHFVKIPLMSVSE